MKVTHYTGVPTEMEMHLTADSHVFVQDESIKEQLSSNIFEFMNEAYRCIGGFHSFTGEDDYADSLCVWYVTTKGLVDVNNLDIADIYTVSVFKYEHGLKLVGVGNNRFTFLQNASERKRKKAEAKSAIKSQIRFASQIGWMEVSGKLDKMVKAILPTSAIIEPEDLFSIFPDIKIMPDGISYARKLSSGIDVVRRAYGNIRL